MGGGGGAEVIYLNWWGGGGGQVFCADRIAPSKKIVMGESPIMTPLPPMQKMRPPHTRKKWHGPHVERKDWPHRKNTPIGEPPALPHGFFYSCSTPWRAPTSPLRAPIMISTHFIPFV